MPRNRREPPSTNGSNGRDRRGRFAKGNGGGPGNPYARRVADLRRSLLHAVSDDDLRQIIRVLVKKAKGGDIHAIREVLTRLIGRPSESMDPDRVDIELEWLKIERQRTKIEAERAKDDGTIVIV